VGTWSDSFLNLPTFSKIFTNNPVSFSIFSFDTAGTPSTHRIVSRPAEERKRREKKKKK